MSDELWRWDAGKLNEAIRTRAVSCKEVVTSCVTRVEAVNPEINAIVEKCFDEAIATAENADRELARGEPVKPLHGVPFTTKINTDQKGYATTNGVAGFANLIADDDSPSIANLRRAGAIVIGRTNCPEFSWRWFTDNDLFGETVNPWSRAHTCGGSTGGGAAAVATGMGPLAQGSDFGGSIRHPALCCGIAGLRPSFGRVPAYNATTGDRPMTAQLMAVHGPLARSVNDLRVALATMAHGDVRDPWWVPAPLVGPPSERPIRVAVMDSDSRLDAGVADALTQAAKWLEDAGYAIERAASPSINEAAHLWSTLVLNESKFGMISQIEQYGGAAIRKTGALMVGRAPPIDFPQYLAALGRRAGLLRTWQIFLQQYPLLLMPTCREPAFELGLDQADEAAMERIFYAGAPLLAPAVLGLPCISVPTGLSNGIPVGVQLVGARFREDICLDAAEAIELRAGPLTPVDPMATG
jgi:amidase